MPLQRRAVLQRRQGYAEKNCIVSQRAFLCTAGHDARDRDFPPMAAEIVVDANAWVGVESYVGPGVTMERDSVCGARAVVTRSVSENAIVVGNPASFKAMRYLPDRRRANAPAIARVTSPLAR